MRHKSMPLRLHAQPDAHETVRAKLRAFAPEPRPTLFLPDLNDPDPCIAPRRRIGSGGLYDEAQEDTLANCS